MPSAPWSAASLARPIRSAPLERCLACEADSVGTPGALPRMRGRAVGTPGALPRMRGRAVGARGALPRMRGRGEQGISSGAAFHYLRQPGNERERQTSPLLLVLARSRSFPLVFRLLSRHRPANRSPLDQSFLPAGENFFARPRNATPSELDCGCALPAATSLKLKPMGGRGIASLLSFVTTPVPKLTTINKFATCASTKVLLAFALLPGLITWPV
jgi:hypothetical protein